MQNLTMHMPPTLYLTHKDISMISLTEQVISFHPGGSPQTPGLASLEVA